MSYKKASYSILLLLALMNTAYFYAALELQKLGGRASIGPGYFPCILAVLLSVLCIIAFVQVLRRHEDCTLSIPNIGLIALTLLLSVAFLIAWQYLDWFYTVVFLFVLALITSFSLYRDLRQHTLNLIIAAILTLMIWGLFGHFMQIRF